MKFYLLFFSLLFFFSSSEVFGDPDKKFIPTKENYNGNVSFTGPRACYDESKRFGETLVINYSKFYNFKSVIVRPFYYYGPGNIGLKLKLLKTPYNKIYSRIPGGDDIFKGQSTFVNEISDIEIEEEGKTTTTSSILYDIIRKFSSGKKINFSFSSENKIQLESDNSIFHLNNLL